MGVIATILFMGAAGVYTLACYVLLSKRQKRIVKNYFHIEL
jgi:hypothetical protein